MTEISKKWRYFRLDGEPPTPLDANWFTIAFHHGGRFYKLGSGNRFYKGGEVAYVDKMEIDTISWTCLNCFAEDLGYRQPPIMYWFKLPGSVNGEGLLPINDDKDVQDMLQFMPRNRVLELYIVGGGVRRKDEAELEEAGILPSKEVDHLQYMGNIVDDLEEVEPFLNGSGDGISNEPEITNGSEKGSQSNVVKNKGGRPKNKKHMEFRNALEKGSQSKVVKNKGGRPKNKKQMEFTNLFANVKGSEATEVDVGGGVNGKRVGQNAKASKVTKKPRRYDTRFMGESSYTEEEFAEESEESNSDDPNFEVVIDSDWELDDEDDEVLFEANVDGAPKNVIEYNDMGFAGDISDGEGEDSEKFDSGTDSTSSDDERERVLKGERKKKKRWSKWKKFTKDDMKNPIFEVGMEFLNVTVLRDALRVFGVKNKKPIRFKTNDSKRVQAACKINPDCPFRIWASVTDKPPTFAIRTLNLQHECSDLEGKVYHCNAPFIAKHYLDTFIADKNWSREGIQSAVARDYGLHVGFQMCYKARRRAGEMAEGTMEDQYNLLESYATVIKRTNSNTSVWIEGDLEGGNVRRFKRIYICFGALKKGWVEGCRSIIGVDGCHLKTMHKGILLTAVGIDGNNGMYPIAYAVVEKETREAWTWFFKFLKDDLCLNNSHSYVFISDKQKGILDTVKELFPNSEHRHCARHLYNNFKGDGNAGQELKDLFWAAARSTTKSYWMKNMDTIHAKSTKAWNFLKGKPAEQWSRSHFGEDCKCDLLLNHCESLNSKILPTRKMPILGLLEDLRLNFMIRLANRRCAGLRWKNKVGPRIAKLLKKNADLSHEYRPRESSTNRFQISRRGVQCQSGVISTHDVDLSKRTCTCRRWNISGLPCPHAICAIYSKGLKPDDFVDVAYSQKKYMLAYGPAINPIPGVEEWEVIEKPILPPAYTRGPGRPPKLLRNKEPDEQHPPPPGTTRPPLGTEKLPRTYYQGITCGRCNKKGHNSRSCERREAQSQTRVESSSSQNQGNGVYVERVSNADNVQPNTCVRTQCNKAPAPNEKSHCKPNWKP